MEHRTLGSSLRVSALSLGCMGMSEFYGADRRAGVDRDDPSRARSRASRCSTPPTCTGRTPTRCSSAARSQGRREGVVVATKFGIVRTGDPAYRGVNGRPEYVRASCEASLRRLAIDVIDLYYQHRVDPGDADRRHRRRDGRPRARGQGAVHRPVRGRRRRRCAARRAFTRSPRCRVSTRSGRATRKAACWPPAASWASASSPTARSAAGS